MADLDHVLDDALAGFDDDEQNAAAIQPDSAAAPQPVASSPSLAANTQASCSSSPPPAASAPASTAAAVATGASTSSSSTGAAPNTAAPAKQKALQFDPLKRKKGSSAGAGSSKASGVGVQALDPQANRLQEDLAQLVAEWSYAMHPVEGEGPAAANTQQQQQQQQRGVLAALQEQTQRTVEQQARVRPPPAAAAGVGGVGGGDDQQQMSMIVDVVMQHLLSKDVLYQPMKEIRDKYPPWLEQHSAAGSSSSLSPLDLERYTRQYECITRLCDAYEAQPANTSHIMALLQEMQACGEPPEDIVADMTSTIAADLPGLAAAGGGGGGPGGASGLADLNFDDLDLGGLGDAPDLKNCPVQ